MPFPIETIRAQFPALAIQDGATPRCYLDNPAGTQVPAKVAEAVGRCLIESNANLGGHFTTSRRAQEVVEAAHNAMAVFLGARSAQEIVLGANMTTLSFHLSRSICQNFSAGDELIVTRMDHEGNISPWLEIAKDKGLVVRWLPFDLKSWQISPQALSELLTPRTRLVCLNYASNLTGAVNDVKALTAVAHAAGAHVYVDAVQLAPHRFIDVCDLGCDFLACSSYKFFGPHLGIVWGREELWRELHAYKCRCSEDTLPYRFETGTPQIELLAGLTETVRYFENLGTQLGANGGGRRGLIQAAFTALTQHETALARQLVIGLDSIPGISLFGPSHPDSLNHRLPTVSFRHETVKPAVIARALAARNIFVWDGHNYAYELVRTLGIPEQEGVVRIGAAHYNTASEVELAVTAVREAIATAR